MVLTSWLPGMRFACGVLHKRFPFSDQSPPEQKKKKKNALLILGVTCAWKSASISSVAYLYANGALPTYILHISRSPPLLKDDDGCDASLETPRQALSTAGQSLRLALGRVLSGHGPYRPPRPRYPSEPLVFWECYSLSIHSTPPCY